MRQEVLIDICANLCALCKEVGLYALDEQKKIGLSVSAVEEKGEIDFVTYVDKEVDRRLVESLQELLPSAGFISEESGESGGDKEYYWVIDPIDGTTNYIHGSGTFCISVALIRNEVPVLGVVYEPTKNELYYAWEGSKAYLNGNPINCSSNRLFSKAMVGFGFSYREELTRRITPFVSELSQKTSTRCMGSAAAELCYIAKGAYDGYIHNDLHIWDIAAASLILKQAGGNIRDFSASPQYLRSREIIAYSNQSIYGAIAAALETASYFSLSENE